MNSKTDKKTLNEKRFRYTYPNLTHFYKEPLVLAKGERQFLWDIEGNKYLDFFGTLMVANCGHAHPKVVKAVQDQMAKLPHTCSLYTTEPYVNAAERLAQIAPGDLEVSYFVNSGTEADEIAVHTARMFTGNDEIVALRHGYAGMSAMAMSLTGENSYRGGRSFAAGISHLRAPYPYRDPHNWTAEDYAADFEDFLRTACSGRPAAFIAEPVMGSGGFIVPPDGYLEAMAKVVRKHGGLFIADEVQSGFGRTGKMFAIEHSNVMPDIMTYAKGVANGLPMGGCITTREIADAMTPYLSISTFGGSPVACAASLAVMEIIKEEKLVENAEAMGQIIAKRFAAMKEKFEVIGDVRGRGLMRAIEFVTDRGTKEYFPAMAFAMQEEARKRGLIIGKGGLMGNCLRVSPPLCITKEDTERAMDVIEECLPIAEKTARAQK